MHAQTEACEVERRRMRRVGPTCWGGTLWGGGHARTHARTEEACGMEACGGWARAGGLGGWALDQRPPALGGSGLLQEPRMVDEELRIGPSPNF